MFVVLRPKCVLYKYVDLSWCALPSHPSILNNPQNDLKSTPPVKTSKILKIQKQNLKMLGLQSTVDLRGEYLNLDLGREF